jgi:hypothetical protein
MYPLNVATLGQSGLQQVDKVSPIKCSRFGPTFDIVNKGIGALELSEMVEVTGSRGDMEKLCFQCSSTP